MLCLCNHRSQLTSDPVSYARRERTQKIRVIEIRVGLLVSIHISMQPPHTCSSLQ
jgi:hypothetical protein